MKKLIYLEDAIDAADRADYTGLAVEDVKKVTDEVVKELQKLPPAQPEIIRCRDCKEFRRWIDTDITFCDCTESEVKEGDFCSRAERRTDD